MNTDKLSIDSAVLKQSGPIAQISNIVQMGSVKSN